MFSTPEAQAAHFAGVTLDRFERMLDQEVAHAEEVEFGQINTNPEDPRFLGEWDLPGEAHEPEEWAEIDAFWDSQREYVENRLN